VTEWRWLEDAGQACHAIQAVLSGASDSLETLHPCPTRQAERRLRLRTEGFDHRGARWAVVVHSGSTEFEPSPDSATLSTRQYRGLIESALTGVMTATLDGRIRLVSPALARVFGFDNPEEMRAEGCLPRWRHPPARKEFIEALKRHGYVDSYPMDAVTRTGRTLGLLLSATLHDDEISVRIIDVGALREAERALAESENRFRATFEQAAVGIAHVALDGRFLRVNRKFCDIAGRSPEKMLTCNFRDITLPDELEADLQHLQELLQGQASSCSVEKRYLARDGGIIWTNLTVSLVRDAAGKPDYLVAVVEDITARKQAEAQHCANERRLRMLSSEAAFAAERERQNLARQLHDHLAQSLTFMEMQLAAARRECAGRRVDATLAKVSETLHQVVRDTRNLMSRIASAASSRPDLPAALAEQVIGELGARYGLEVELMDDGHAKPLSAEAGAILLRSVRELLMNVVKHAGTGRATVSLRRSGQRLEVVVADRGRGLPAGPAPGRKSAAYGFGLFSIEEQIGDLGGSFAIEGGSGQGVRATLSVPLEVD
jgi:two-component system sensor histidine kinase UhpB